MKQLEASEKPLNKVLCRDYEFSIPDYQRPYSWGIDESVQLLSDVAEAMDESEVEPYFLGSIVLVKDPSDARAQVIDGQQRLTTVSILVAVLRDLSTEDDDKSAFNGFLREEGNSILNLSAKPRLSLRRRDRRFFHEHVQADGCTEALARVSDNALQTDAQKNIRDNTRALSRILKGWDEEKRRRLAKMLMSNTYLVVVSTPDLESAHRIFSVMNSRGLDLTPADIFKAKVIGEISDALSEEYTNKWEDAEEAVDRDAFAELFLHIRLIVSKERAKQSILKEFPSQVLDAYLPDRATNFVDDVLIPYANAYMQVTTFQYSSTIDADKINAWLRRLDLLDFTDWQAPALWALKHHGADASWLDSFFRKLERLSACLFICRVFSTPRVLRFIDLLNQLDGGMGLDSSAFELTINEKRDMLARLNGDIYGTVKTRLFILLRLDEVLARSSGVSYNFPVITVEHVLPQNPDRTSEWRNNFNFVDEERWKNSLANLVLLNRRKNSQAQNYDFTKKKELYFRGSTGTSNFAITSQVLAESEWTPEVLRRRQDELISELSKEWEIAR